MKTSWRDFVKTAGMVSSDRKTFTLPSGKAPWHVAKEIKKLYPGVKYDLKKITDMILSANPGVKNGRFISGRQYKLPSFDTPVVAAPASLTQVPPGKMKVRSGFVDFLEHMEDYGITNSVGKLDMERAKAGIINYMTRPDIVGSLVSTNSPSKPVAK